MALRITGQAPTLCLRREAYEQSGLTRAEVDTALDLTADEFRVEGNLVVIGPIYGVELDDIFRQLEERGLRHFDDYFEFTGNWPDWLNLYVAAS